MNLRLALRNLRRNPWRTGLTIGGVAFGNFILIMTTCVQFGMLDHIVESTISTELGHLKLQDRKFVDEPSIYNSFPVASAEIGRIKATEGVAGAAPRLHSFGLIGNQARSRAVRFIGVDPAEELTVTKIADRVLEGGRWLSASSSIAAGAERARTEVVLGKILADQLGAKVNDELLILVGTTDGSMGDDVVRVAGIASTGSSVLDRGTVYVPLSALQALSVADDRLHEVALRVQSPSEIGPVKSRMNAIFGAGSPLIVRTWDEIVPDIHDAVKFSRSAFNLLYLVIFFLAGLGVLNTQRMSALERRRELGVLSAIGMTPRQLAWLLALESALLCAIGSLAGGGLGAAAASYLAKHGLMIVTPGGGKLQFLGTTVDVIAIHLTPELILVPVVGMILAGTLTGLWPALQTMRIDAIRAISGRV